MKRLKIIVEGQTEETFVNNCLSTYMFRKCSDWSDIRPLLVMHSEKNGIKYKGGIRRQNGYHYILQFIEKLIKEDKNAFYSTMFDFYAFPQDVSNYDTIKSKTDPYDKVKYLEDQFYNDVYNATGFTGFIPYVQLHEFEALLFSNPHAYYDYLINESQLKLLEDIKNSVATPEHINNGPNTAPSKRLIQIIPGYDKLKVVEGPNLAELIGIESIRASCKHFSEWLERLGKLE